VTGEAGALRLCGLYLPNGNPAPGPKYDYKLAWMERMRARAVALLATEEPVLMGGDYNVIPQDEDAARPEAWRDDALALPDSRAAFRRLLHLGLTEPACRGRGITRSGITRAARGRETTASASTTCCSARRPQTG
jgi:exodeoxyribonuclease-3